MSIEHGDASVLMTPRRLPALSDPTNKGGTSTSTESHAKKKDPKIQDLSVWLEGERLRIFSDKSPTMEMSLVVRTPIFVQSM